jgi:hypothetical protein
MKLYSFNLLLICLDIFILLMWSVLDPLVKNTIYLPDEFVSNEDAETIYKPELETCKCKNGIVWIGNFTL